MKDIVDLIGPRCSCDRLQMSRQDVLRMKNYYYACVSFVDYQVGRIVQALKDKGIYAEVQKTVSAAEKWAQNHDIDKNEWVVAALEEIGITVTPRVKRWIEAAVMELDLAVGMATTPDLSALGTSAENDK